MSANKSAKISASSLPLPTELILEVFSRLPSKSLQRLWSIFDDDLTQLLETSVFQHKHAFNVLNQPSSKLLFCCCYSEDFIHEFDHYSFMSPRQTTSVTRTYNFDQLFDHILPYETPMNCCRVIGACNGLICLHIEFYQERVLLHRLILWNPFTGEHHRALPTPRRFKLDLFDDDVGLKPFIIIYGFGYDAANNTYKLVIAEDSLTQIYDLSTNVWKIIETNSIDDRNDVDYFSFTFQFGHYLDGSLHWIMSRMEIASINLSTEVNSRLKLPNCCSSKDNEGHCTNFGVLKGCLSVACCPNNNGDKLNIWLLKEYGREGSWTNISSIKLETNKMFKELFFKPPLWVSHDEEMLFLVDDLILCWFPKDEKLCHLENLEPNGFSRWILHVDTLVSPKPDVYGLGKHNDNKVLISN